MKALFTRPDAWNGGEIEVLMHFPDATLEQSIRIGRVLWSFDRLDGPYRNRQVEPHEQKRVDCSGFSLAGCEQLIGVIRHHDGTCSTFTHSTIFDEDGLWIYAGVPTGSLPEEWQVGSYPFGDDNPGTWLEPFIVSLRAIADHVHASFPIRAAMYGWLDSVAPGDLLMASRGKMPDERWIGISVWNGGNQEYYPPTRHEAPFAFPLPRAARDGHEALD